ncbi:MAG: NAD-dependent DNA ligase LigA [Candidatus Tritonobacter lacicola]|nr:NAD-dependent DNA ligase LigA [Candidatus Tritonobacter lacicola]
MKRAKAVRRIQALKSEIARHNYLYYVENRPEISDREFDELMKELLELEGEFPGLVTRDSPTRRVGGEPVAGFRVVTHEIPMLSLDNTYSRDEIEEFDGRVEKNLKGRDYEYVVDLKIDGVAVSLRYEEGKLTVAATRGDGRRGDDITHNVRTIRAVPLTLRGKSIPPVMDIRGEIYMDRESFKKVNREREKSGEEPFANPRNATAGSLKLLDPSIAAKRRLNIFIHSIGQIGELGVKTHYEALHKLKGFGLRISNPLILCPSIDDVSKVCGNWEKKRDGLAFEVDGIVAKVNSLDQQKLLGATSKAPRWAIAYKFAARQATTRIRDIIVQVGRQGSLTPVAVLDPVFVDGSTVGRATLHNEDEVSRKDIRIGDTVVIEKGGDVIPKVVGPVTSKRTGRERCFVMPDRCPVCGSPAARHESEVAVRCENVACPAQVKARVKHFASRGAMDIEGLGSELVDQLVRTGLVKDYGDLYSLKEGGVAALDRMGEKSARNLIRAIEESRKRPLRRLVFALGIRNVGSYAARVLADRHCSVDDLMNARPADMEKTHEIGPVMAGSVASFFGNKENIKVVKKLKAAGVNMKAGRLAGDLAGQTFVLTGGLEDFTRTEAAELIESRGGSVSGSVGRKTDVVVVGKDPGSKYERAEKLGVKTINEQEFKKLLNP